MQAGSDSISINATAYRALYLHQTALDSSLYGNLVFWIDGGPAGGQLLQVQATLSGAAQAGVTCQFTGHEKCRSPVSRATSVASGKPRLSRKHFSPPIIVES